MKTIQVKYQVVGQLYVQDESLPSEFIHRPHPPIPDAQRLQQLNDIWSVKQCPHCHSIWNRDVNACRCDR
jgi:hypothetical protein